MRSVASWMTDMDGVLVHEDNALPGAADFIAAMEKYERPYIVLTNNSIFTARDLRARLQRSGIDVPEEQIWTSALATAEFLAEQAEGQTLYAIGELGLTSALHDKGFVLNDKDPDIVVLGETRTYSFEAIAKAVRFIEGGARFICTNPDPTGPTTDGTIPATGAIAALISSATGRQPYFVGKPNPLMMRTALNRIEGHSETTVMIGDRMDTDIICGLEAGLRTILVLSGSTKEEEVATYPYRPSQVLSSIAEVVPLVERLCPGEDEEMSAD
jgi:NagD protein